MNQNKKSFFNKGIFPSKWAFTLLIPLRNIFLSPKTLLKRLDLKSDDKILEVGCGPGYFSPSIAKAIPRGQLTLVDIQKEIIDKARARIGKFGYKNTEFVTCDGESLPFVSN